MLMKIKQGLQILALMMTAINIVIHLILSMFDIFILALLSLECFM